MSSWDQMNEAILKDRLFCPCCDERVDSRTFLMWVFVLPKHKVDFPDQFWCSRHTK